MKKKRKKEHAWWLLNPKYLQKQIDGYGYYFSWGNYVISLLISFGGIFVCGRLFSLSWYMVMILAVAWIIMLPGMLLNGYKNMYEHKKFLEASDYMEQILYSFQQEGKILSALRDTESLFPEGRMRTTISETIAYIEQGTYEHDLYQEAFQKIEEQYPGRRMIAIHSFLRVIEKNGGDYRNGIRLLLADKALWVENVLLLQEEKKRGRTRVIVALLITILLAAVFHGVYRTMPEQYSIINNSVTQIATTCYFLLNMLIFRKANQELAKSWLEREIEDDEKKVREYWKIVTQKKSPYRLSYRICYNWLVKEINLRFPQWLMELALLLQGNNVQVAISKTVTEAPTVLRPELEKMIEKLKEQPESMEPYMEFLNMFQLSYVQSAMKMLYAISESGNGDSQEQIQVMVQRNEKLLDQAEKILNERKLAGITTAGYLPQITISFEMMINMAVFMMVFLTKMSI